VTREISEIKNAILEPKKGSIPPLWDGFATERVLEVIHANHG
jgi:hypothetical protein